MDHNQEEIELIICLVLTFEITFLNIHNSQSGFNIKR